MCARDAAIRLRSSVFPALMHNHGEVDHHAETRQKLVHVLGRRILRIDHPAGHLEAEVGDAAMFLLSDLSRSVTGEIMHVDSGYHVVGMKAEDAPDIAVPEPKAFHEATNPHPVMVGTDARACGAIAVTRLARTNATAGTKANRDEVDDERMNDPPTSNPLMLPALVLPTGKPQRAARRYGFPQWCVRSACSTPRHIVRSDSWSCRDRPLCQTVSNRHDVWRASARASTCLAAEPQLGCRLP